MKKTLLVCMLLIAIVLSFAACGGKDNPPSNSGGNGNETPVHTHSFGEWETTKNPTCTENGTKVRYCSCGEKQSEIVVSLGHTPAEATIENKIEATCNADGSYDEVVYCSVEACKEELSRESKSASALGHDFKITENVEATCLEDGHIYFECQRKNCSETKKQTLLSSGHYFGEDKVCDNCGYTEADNHIHSYTATIVAPSCTNLGYTLYECTCGDKYRTDYIEQKGHRWDDGAVETAKTCATNGVMLYTCLDCGTTHRESIAASHEWSETITQAPTCAENGSAQKVCSGCGAEEGVVLPAAHTWGTETVIKQNTCTEKGLASHTCTVCSASEEFDLELLGHTYKNGTCTKCGKSFTEGVTPYPEHPEYGMYFEIDDIISKYGPDYINEYGVLLDYNESAKIEKVAVFLTQDGTMWRRCIACVGSGIEYATYVPYLSYENDIKYTGLNSQWINIFPLKENSDGIWCYSNYTTIGVNLEDQYGNLLLSLYDIGQAGTKTRVFDDLNEMIAWLSSNCDEHIESDWIVDSFASCTSIGSRHTECINCGAIITTEISPATDHSFGEWGLAYPATCLYQGYYERICTTCGEIETQYISATGHSYVNGICTSCGAPDPDYVPEDPNYSVGLEYTSNGDGTCYVSGFGTCTDTDIVIPEVSPEGWTVVGIIVPEIGGFNTYTTTSISIPATVTEIDGWSIIGAEALKYIAVDENNQHFKSVDGHLFTKDGTKLIKYATANGSDEYVIPYGVTTVGRYAFYSMSCNTLKYVSIPETVTTIESWAFAYCTGLAYIKIPNGVTELNLDSFAYTHLDFIVIPKSMTHISGYFSVLGKRFGDIYYEGIATEWASVKIDEESSNSLSSSTRYYYSETAPTTEGNFWHYVDGVPAVWDAYVAPETPAYSVGLEYQLSSDGTYYIVTGIGTCADADVVIPTEHNGLTVTQIGHEVFMDKLVTSVTIPSTITYIQPMAFNRCYSLQWIDVSDDNPYYKSIDGNLYNKDATVLIKYACGKSETVFTIPDSVVSFGNYTMAYASNLETAILGKGLTSILGFTFADCESLKNIVLSQEVTKIDNWSFQGCVALTNVYYYGTPETWQNMYIEDGNEYLENATRYYYSETEPTTEGNFWHYIDGVPTVWDAHIHSYTTATTAPTCTAQGYTTYTCACGDSYVGDYTNALGHTEAIDSAVDATCTTSGLTEGKHCSACGEILVAQNVIPAGHNYVDGKCSVCGEFDYSYYAFALLDDGTYEISVNDINKLPNDIVIPRECKGIPVTRIANDTFNANRGRNCFDSITIPDTIKSIGEYAFDCCVMKEVYVYDLENWLNIEFENSGSYPHRQITYISTLHFLDFNGNELTEVIIPESITSIGYMAFSVCNSLEKIIIPKTITNIDAYAFDYCLKLSGVFYLGTELEWNKININSDFYSNSDLLNATRYYYSETQPTTEGNFWHYVDGEPTVWDAYVAPEAPAYSEGLEYTSNGDGTCNVSGIGTCDDTFVVIPEISPDGHTVVKIDTKAFENCAFIERIFIPKTIEETIWDSFVGCDIKAVYIEDLSAWCKIFFNMSWASNPMWCGADLYLNNKLVTQVIIPEDITSLIDSTFEGCTSITSVVIHKNISYIAWSSFNNCNNLNAVYYTGTESEWNNISIWNDTFKAIPRYYYSETEPETVGKFWHYVDGVATPWGAFVPPADHQHNWADWAIYSSNGCSCQYDTTYIRSCPICGIVEYKNELATGHTYGEYQLSVNTSGLPTCQWNPVYKAYCTKCNHDYCYLSQTHTAPGHSYSNSVCIYCGDPEYIAPAENELEFASNGDGTCYVSGIGNYKDKNLVIPEVSPQGWTVTGIGDYAFENCHIENVEYPTTITHIGSYAFYNCALKNIIIPDSVTSMGSCVFMNCSNAKTLVVGNGLTSMYLLGWEGCNAIISITIGENITSIGMGPSALAPVEIINKSQFDLSSGDLYTNHLAANALVIHSGETKIVTDNDFLFYTHEGTNYLLGYVGDDTDLVLPESYNGESYEIYRHAFYGNKSIASIEITGNVTSIGYDAFYNCSNLSNVVIGDSVTYIGDSAFNYCQNLTGIVIGDKVSYIGSFAFGSCSNLKSVVIGISVDTIKNYAFSYCASLEEIYYNATSVNDLNYDNYVFQYAGQSGNGIKIVIGKNVKYISDYLFNPYPSYSSYSPKISSIKFENGSLIESIGNNAFSSSIDIAYNEYDNAYYIGSDSNPYLVLMKSKSTDITSCTIHPDTRIINGGAFNNCQKLESINIPNNVVSIGNSAFYGCINLRSISLSTAITRIEDYTFEWCERLTDIAITNNVTYIGPYAFSGCLGLVSITIPKSVTYIGDWAFNGCLKLVEVINHSDLEITVGAQDNGCVAYYAKEVHQGNSKIVTISDYLFYSFGGVNYLIGYIGEAPDLILPENFNGTDYKIYAYAFSLHDNMISWGSENRIGITSIIIPESVTAIGDYAFYYSLNLESVTILGNNLVSIGASAFSGCYDLNSINIPSSVSFIGDYAFSGCSGIVGTIELNNIITIGNCAFSSCSNLTEVIISSTKLTNIGNSAFSYCSNLKRIVMPQSIASIGEYAFSGCSSLEDITIPVGVTIIGNRAFANCTSLTSITIPNSVDSIGSYAFDGCYRLAQITLPDSITNIGDYAFNNCSNLKSISMPDSLTAIAEGTFYGSGLESITIGKNVTSIGARAFQSCYYLENIVIPDNVTSVSYSVFNGCSNLVNVTLGKGLSAIGEYMFANCYSLATVDIPDNIYSIGMHAFDGCGSLTSIIIPQSVTSINYYVFNGCYNLTIYAEAESEPSGWFAWNKGNCPVVWGYHKHRYLNDICTSCGHVKPDYSEGMNYTLSDDETYYTVSGIGTCTDSYVIIPSTYNGLPVTAIGQSAFSGKKFLKKIYIPDSITRIENYAFSGCELLNEITIPNAVTHIGDSAFNDCIKLKSIFIPAGVISIGNGAFYGCYSLLNLEVSDDNTAYKSIGGNLYTKDGKTLLCFLHGNTKTEFTIPDGVTKIEQNAFTWRTNLNCLFIPDSVTHIESNAFSWCNINFITLPNSVTYIDANAFSLNNNCIIYCGVNEKLDTWNDSWVSNYCTVMWGFVSFGITDNDLYYAERADEVYIIGSKNTDPEIIIPQNINGKVVTRICNNAFYYSANLESVIIPDTITNIGNSAFSGCSNLASLIIGNSVTNIGEYAFSSCQNLKSVVIGSSVTSIKNSAFSYCYALEALYYVGSSISWNKVIIENTYDYNSYLINAPRYYYSETAPTTEGNFWHYVDGVPTIW